MGHAIAGSWAKHGKGRRRQCGLQCKGRVPRIDEVRMKRPDLINERDALGPCHEMVGIIDWRRTAAIQIGRQEGRLGRPPCDPESLPRGRWIAHEHFHSVEHKSLRPKKRCVWGVENIGGHVIAIRPHAYFRIIEVVVGEMKLVTIISASGVPSLRNGDTLIHWDAGGGRNGRLAHDPAVREPIIVHYRVAAAGSLTDPAIPTPQ